MEGWNTSMTGNLRYQDIVIKGYAPQPPKSHHPDQHHITHILIPYPSALYQYNPKICPNNPPVTKVGMKLPPGKPEERENSVKTK